MTGSPSTDRLACAYRARAGSAEKTTGSVGAYISKPVNLTFILPVVVGFDPALVYVKPFTFFSLPLVTQRQSLLHSISILDTCTTSTAKRSEGVQEEIMAGLQYDAMDGLEETGPRVTVREVSLLLGRPLYALSS